MKKAAITSFLLVCYVSASLFSWPSGMCLAQQDQEHTEGQQQQQQQQQTVIIGGESQRSYGSLLVMVDPSGAEIEFDGGFVATGTVKLERVPVGAHHVRVSCRGYDPEERSVYIPDGQQVLLRLSLSRTYVAPPTPPVPTFGSILVTTDRDMKIYCDGNFAGTGRRVTIDHLEPGRHKISVTCYGCAFDPDDVYVRVTAGETAHVSLDSVGLGQFILGMLLLGGLIILAVSLAADEEEQQF